MLFHSSSVLFIKCIKLLMIPSHWTECLNRLSVYARQYSSSFIITLSLFVVYSVEWKSFDDTPLKWKTFEWRRMCLFFLHHNWCPFHKFKNITVNNVMLMLMTITKSCIRYDNFSLSKFTAMLIWHSKALGEFKIEKIYLETECKNWQTKTFFASRHFAYSTSIKIASRNVF